MINGLYVHIPFCLRKCRYCGFYSIPYAPDLAERFLRSLQREMKLNENEYKFNINSIYIGGGTPSVLPVDQLQELLRSITDFAGSPISPELTIEVNPGTGGDELPEILRAAGVNRISLGVQSFCDRNLKYLGRIHTSEDAVRIFGQFREAGFSNISIDLMFALPGQSREDWKKDLKKAVELGSEHISLYGLNAEEGTPLRNDVDSGKEIMPDEEEYAVMYEDTLDALSEAGYSHYEISNFARSGHECRHNLLYWQAGEYLGLGPGAHSYAGKKRCWNYPDVNTYAGALEKEILPRENEEIISGKTEEAEFLFLSLRTLRGISGVEYRKRFGKSFEETYNDKLLSLISGGMLAEDGGRFFLTRRGLLAADTVMAEFV